MNVLRGLKQLKVVAEHLRGGNYSLMFIGSRLQAVIDAEDVNLMFK